MKKTLNSKNDNGVDGRKGFHDFSNEYLLYTFFTLMKVAWPWHAHYLC